MDLVTGGTGFIGSTLAKTLLDQNWNVATFDIKPSSPVLEAHGEKWRHFQGNLGNMGEVLTVIQACQPKTIFHLGGMLSTPSEQNPQASFLTNVVGTYNVLEGARLFAINQVICASTNGTFGLDLEGLKVIDGRTLQRPFTMYGCGKLFGELLGRYYHRKYGIDFRSSVCLLSWVLELKPRTSRYIIHGPSKRVSLESRMRSSSHRKRHVPSSITRMQQELF
jgi:threonine 3-dehydrogenase